MLNSFDTSFARNALEVKFIDIDWGGADGQVRYPAFINHRASWPVLDPTDQPIKQSHDETMLQKTLSDSKIMRRDVMLRSMPHSRPGAVLHIRPQVMIQTASKRGRTVSTRLR